MPQKLSQSMPNLYEDKEKNSQADDRAHLHDENGQADGRANLRTRSFGIYLRLTTVQQKFVSRKVLNLRSQGFLVQTQEIFPWLWQGGFA